MKTIDDYKALYYNDGLNLSAEDLGNFKKLVGERLYEAEEDVRVLANVLNFGPDLDEDEDKNLDTLFHVTRLLEVSSGLWPYDTFQD